MPVICDCRQPGGELGDEAVAAAAVGLTSAADVAVVGAGREQVGEHELLEHGRAVVGDELGRGDVFGEVAWDDDPAEPQRRRQRL